MIEERMIAVLAARIGNLEIEKARLIAQAHLDAEEKEAKKDGDTTEQG